MKLWLILALVVLACGGPSSGTIVKKSYTGPSTTYQQTCSFMDPKTGLCIAYTFLPIDWPAEWAFKLRDDNQDKPVNQRDTAWVDVTEEDYSRYKTGEHYP